MHKAINLKNVSLIVFFVSLYVVFSFITPYVNISQPIEGLFVDELIEAGSIDSMITGMAPVENITVYSGQEYAMPGSISFSERTRFIIFTSGIVVLVLITLLVIYYAIRSVMKHSSSDISDDKNIAQLKKHTLQKLNLIKLNINSVGPFESYGEAVNVLAYYTQMLNHIRLVLDDDKDPPSPEIAALIEGIFQNYGSLTTKGGKVSLKMALNTIDQIVYIVNSV